MLWHTSYPLVFLLVQEQATQHLRKTMKHQFTGDHIAISFPPPLEQTALIICPGMGVMVTLHTDQATFIYSTKEDE